MDKSFNMGTLQDRVSEMGIFVDQLRIVVKDLSREKAMTDGDANVLLKYPMEHWQEVSARMDVVENIHNYFENALEDAQSLTCKMLEQVVAAHQQALGL